MACYIMLSNVEYSQESNSTVVISYRSNYELLSFFVYLKRLQLERVIGKILQVSVTSIVAISLLSLASFV